jgi:ketosteroid isomerase-like protein
VGKAAILKQIAESDKPNLNTFSWTSEKAVVSSSGDLGYIWGHYQVKAKTKAGADTTLTGAYCTIYKKTRSGAWKAVMDQNKLTPIPD